MKSAQEKEGVAHTPTPWAVGFNESITGPSDTDPVMSVKIIAQVNRGLATSKADAAFIVRAVNAHEDMLDALRACNKELGHKMNGELADQVDDAIAKAEGR